MKDCYYGKCEECKLSGKCIDGYIRWCYTTRKPIHIKPVTVEAILEGERRHLDKQDADGQ